MKIVYLGGGQFGLHSLSAVARSRHHLAMVVTHPPRPAGRGRKPRHTPVADWANRNNVSCLETKNVNDSHVIERIKATKPDLILVIAFGQYIGKTLRELPAKGTINVHASLLPKYRGAAPINWAIINGETETGITIITVAKKMDAGDIIATAKTHIDPNETAGSLHDRLAELAPEPMITDLDEI